MHLLENPWIVAAIVIGAVGYVIVRRTIGEPVNVRELTVPPLVLIVLGAREVVRAGGVGDGLEWLIAAGVVSVLCGAARAATVRLFVRDGVVWYRYTPTTFATWLITAAIGVGARLAAFAEVPEEARSMMLTIGLTLAGEGLILGWRAEKRTRSSRAPFPA